MPTPKFRTSEHTDLIDTQLAIAEAKTKTAAKDSSNPHFRNRFASLESCFAAVKPAMNEAGISILQPATAEGTKVIVTTRLSYKGQWYEADLEMTAAQNTPQAIGSCITYARRYGLSSFVALPTGEGEDDAEAAMPVTEVHPQPATRTEALKAKVAAKANGTGPSLKDRVAAVVERLKVYGYEDSTHRQAKALEILGHNLDPKSEADVSALEKWLNDSAQQQTNDAAEVLGAMQ